MSFFKSRIIRFLNFILIAISFAGCKRTPTVMPSDKIIYIPRNKAGHYAEGWLFKDKNEIKSICDALSAVSRKDIIQEPEMPHGLSDMNFFLFIDDKDNIREDYTILGDFITIFPDGSSYSVDEPVKKMRELISKGAGEKQNLEQIRSIKGIEKYINFEWVEMEAEENKE